MLFLTNKKNKDIKERKKRLNKLRRQRDVIAAMRADLKDADDEIRRDKKFKVHE